MHLQILDCATSETQLSAFELAGDFILQHLSSWTALKSLQIGCCASTSSITSLLLSTFGLHARRVGCTTVKEGTPRQRC